MAQRSQSRREPSNKLADLFDNEQSGSASVSKSVSFKYKSGQSSNQKPTEAQTNGTASNSSSQRNVIYQETVQLYNYKDQQHVHLGAAGVAILGTAAGTQLLVYLSKQKTIASVALTPSFNITLQKDNYVCFYDQKSQLWYLLFPDFDKLVSFAMHILISKYSNEEEPDNKIHFMEVQSGDASEVVSHSSKAQIKYSAHVVDGAKVGKKIDNNKDSAAKLLNVDLTAKKGSVVTGLKDGLVGMSRDSTRVILIPPKLAYGSSGLRNKVPPNSYLIYEASVVKVSQVSSRTQRSSSSEVPLPKLSNRDDDDEEDGISESGRSDDEDDTQGEGEESSTADDTPNSSSATRAKILQRTAKLGQAVLPPKREVKSSPKAAQQPTPAVADEMSFQTSTQPIYPSSNQVALYNAPMAAAGHQMYPQQAPLMQPQMPPTYQHPTHLQSTIMPTSSLIPAPVAFGASTPAMSTSGLDQSVSNNLQLTMLESKQIQNDVRSQMMQVSSKLDQVHQKVETLASRDSMMGTSGSQVTLEAAVLVQNIQRIVQENQRLKEEAEQARLTNESQTEKIASLLAQNQKYLEQSNIMLEQRNESFQSVSSASQIKITQLEQEKTQMLNEMNSLNNKISELQFDLSTQKQRQLDFKSQVNEEAVGKNQLREEVAAQKVKITELEEDFSKAKNAYREQRAARKHAESRIVDLEEQLTDVKSEVESLNRQLSERKRRAKGELDTQQKEIEETKQMYLSEIESLKSRLEAQRKMGTDANLALSKVEADLDNQWREKCEAMVKQTRNQLDDQLKLANERAENLLTEVSSSKTKIVELNSTVSNLKRDLIESQEQLHLKKDEVLSLQNEMDKLQYELDKNAKSVSSEVLLPEVKKIMNTIYQVLAKHLDKEAKYTGSSLLNFMKIVIKDVTLSVSSGKQPNCLTDSSTLIEPIPEDESDEDEDEADGISSEEEGPKSPPPRPKDSSETPGSKKDSVASENEVLPETEVPVTTSVIDGVNPVLVQSPSTGSDVSETSVVETDRIKRQSQSGTPFDADALLPDSDEKAQSGATETQHENATNEIDTSSSHLKADDDADNSDSEGVPVLDPRNLPSSDSENEQDASYNSPLNTSNLKESSDVMKSELVDESQPNEESVLVVDSPNELNESENVKQQATESPVSIVVEKADTEAPPEDTVAAITSPAEGLGDTPPSLPESPRIEPPSDSEMTSPQDDAQDDDDRVVGGASLPAFRPATPSSEDSEDEIAAPTKPAVDQSQSDKNQRIFDDSDSDDSLFGNSTKINKPQPAPARAASTNSTASKDDVEDTKGGTGGPAKKKTTSLFPSDDEDLDWLK